MTAAIILNVMLASAIFAIIVGLLACAIATQSRDDGGQAVAKRREIDRRRAPAARPRTARSDAGHIERRQGHGLA
jgi:hypothetical protein